MKKRTISYQVRDPEAEKKLKELGKTIRNFIPSDDYAWAVFLFPQSPKACFYMANANRREIIEAMKEWIANQESRAN